MDTDSLHLTPIIKVVGNYCNNDCGYCFYHNLDQMIPNRMSFELLESFIHQHAELVQGKLSFIWHGGEPLLAGLDFFQEVIRLQKLLVSKDRPTRNSIQTNGTLVTDEWAAFFKQNDFRIGVSLDGDEESHNKFRVNHSGYGTFKNTVRGIKILREYGIRLSVIQTIPQANVCQVERNFKFFTEELGLDNFGINPYLDLTESNISMKGQSLSNDTLTSVLNRCIDLWIERNDGTLRVREIDNLLAGVLNKRAKSCSFNGSCHSFYSVDYDGCIFPCDRLSGDKELCLGSLTEQPLKEILHGIKWQDFITKVSKLPNDCIICEWKDACNNGCTAHRVNGIGGKYFFCETRKEVLTSLLTVSKNQHTN